ncbi:MAG TPA: sugar phosphate nucleotidyltransferase [Chromatiaceae bacterium]|nr:sugar phosphate nucleotidyltransferase [Chromatiaceae bacterium]
MPDQTLTIVKATGQDECLAPLTLHRAKAAVPFGGKFRIIDFTLANCLHSGLRQILVLTQWKSHSLQKHLRDGWSIFHPELGEYITPIPPQMREGTEWYGGLFSAMRQNRYLIERNADRFVLALDGDLVYRMDYAELIRHHRERGAVITAACRGTDTGPKPALAFDLAGEDRVRGLLPADAPASSAGCAPMGVYLFNKDFLLDLLESAEAVIAADQVSVAEAVAKLAGDTEVFVYRFGGERGRVSPDRYWNNLSSIDDYYQANMALLEHDPPLNLYQSDWKIFTAQGQNPPARTIPGLSGTEGIFVNSMLAAGTVISGGGVNHSILFPGVRVMDGAIVEDAILFNGVSVGERSHLRRCIIDKEVEVPPGTAIGINPAADKARFHISADGLVVIPKGYKF